MSEFRRDRLSGGLRVDTQNCAESEKYIRESTNGILSIGGKYERDNKINYTGKVYNSMIEMITEKQDFWCAVEKQIFNAVYKYTADSNRENWNFGDNDISFGVLHLLEALYTEQIVKDKKITYINLGEVRKLLKKMETVKEYTISKIEDECGIK